MIIKKLNNQIMELISEKFNIWKLRLADRLMVFCLDNKIDNEIFLKFLFFIYQVLLHNSYVLKYKSANHHYIPRFLLKKFKIPGTGQIFQYTYFKSPQKVSINKEAACVRNLYSFKDRATKGKSDFVENQVFAFALEKYASRIIHQILKTGEINDLTNLERSIITSFIAFQYIRTPRFFHFVRLVLEYLNLQGGIPLDEMVKVDFYKKTFFDNYYQITPQKMGQFGKKNKLNLSGADDLILRLSMQIGDHLSSFIYRRTLCLLNVRLPGFFYLSDNPMEIFNISHNRSIGPFLWEIERNPLIFMPISPSLCLYFLKGEIPPPHVIGSVLEKAIPESIYEFAFTSKESDKIKPAFNAHPNIVS